MSKPNARSAIHVLTALLALPILSAAADTLAATAIRDFGLLGTWAMHCDSAIAQDNAFVSYEIRDGVAVRTVRTYFQEAAGTAIITEARIVDATHIEWTWKMREFTFDQTIELNGDRYRLIRSKGGDGVVYYEDAHNPADGKETPWLERCKAGTNG